MSTSGQHDSGPAGVIAPSYPSGSYAVGVFDAPPRYTHYKSNTVVAGRTTTLSYVDERRPLLSQPQPKPGPRAEATCFSLLVILGIIFLLCPLLYLIVSGLSGTVDHKSLYQDATARIQRLTANNLALGKEVTLYKDMYEDVRLRAVHLEQEKSALEGEVHTLQTKLHDVREHLTNAKVLAFWEIARIMHTNTYVPRSPPLTRLIARS
jgi:hypothetical protein